MNFNILDNCKKVPEAIWEEFFLPFMRKSFFNETFVKGPGSGYFFESFKNFFRLSQFEFIQKILPQFDRKKTNVSWIPINKPIEGADEVALPEEILGRFIEKAKHRVIVNFCGCRAAKGCENYPENIGCLMMGESALLIPENARKEVGIEEAKAHVRKAIEAGLVPVTGKARIDNDIFMIPDYGKLLTVCFCCECCCITRFTRYLPKDLIDEIHKPVEGLSIQITDECIGCGKCVTACYIGAIEIVNDKAKINDICRICGRCALKCPQNAIKLRLNNSRAVQDVAERIEAIIDF